MDIKIAKIATADGASVRRYQYTAVDNARRIHALMIYAAHTQKKAIAVFDHAVERFPFRIHTIRTDRGHEWQPQFHWHVEDRGVRHVYIKPLSPQLNGKVERSHRTDQEEFYQLLTFKDDVDLPEKLAAWEQIYNLSRPHCAHGGKAPYEALQGLLVHNQAVSAGRQHHKPCVFWLPDTYEFRYGFVFKQEHNGATFVVLPFPLPWLAES